MVPASENGDKTKESVRKHRENGPSKNGDKPKERVKKYRENGPSK
jgi:hypothetical protein